MSKTKNKINITGNHEKLISEFLESKKYFQILRLNAILEQGKISDLLINEIMGILKIEDKDIEGDEKNKKDYKQFLVNELSSNFKIKDVSKEVATKINNSVKLKLNEDNNKIFNDFLQDPGFSQAFEYITGKKKFDELEMPGTTIAKNLIKDLIDHDTINIDNK